MLTFLLQTLNMIRSGGNFGFIAQNIATIYYALSVTTFGKSLKEDQKLYATGLIDAAAYIQDGSIDISEIDDCVSMSALGYVGFLGTTFPIMTKQDEKNFRLIAFSMQLEAYIFTSHEIIDYRSVVSAVLKNEKHVVKMINKTLLQGSTCNIFPNVLNNVLTHINSKEFQNIVLSYNKKR